MSMQGNLSVERMCSLAQVSRAGFYRSLKGREPDFEEMELRSAIQSVAVENRRRYGYRRIAAELRHRGLLVNHKRVVRLMRMDNLLAVRPSAFVGTTNSNHDFEIHVNLAKRMQLTGINQLWLADITFVRLQQEFVYLAVILDAFSRKVVGWALERSLAAQRAVAALQQAIASRRPPPGLVHHSDRGIQYASSEYGNVLEQHRIVASMSRLGNPWDNAKCESFMKTLKQEEIHANIYRDLDHLRSNVGEFIEHYYNTQRLHSALSYQSPDGFEQSIAPASKLPGVKVSFFRHGEIFQSDGRQAQGEPPEDGSPAHRLDESPTGYSSPGWSPPEPDSALPVTVILQHGSFVGKKK
jgi:putative transposase